MSEFKHHYIVSYNSELWEERTSIVSRTEPYANVEEFVEEIEEYDNDSSIQVEEFREVNAVAAFILGLF